MFKVLVVDDDPNVRLFLDRLLTKKFSCKVETAKNGADALAKLKEFDAEVMLLDITMPVMDGVETLTAIRQDDKFKDLEVIILSAVSEKGIVAKVMSMGVVDYMLKPLLYEQTYLRLKELFDIVRKRLQKKKLSETGESVLDENIDYSIKRFLLIIPDETFRSKLEDELTKLGYVVLSADNGAEGLKLFVKYKPQTIVLSENLPLLNERLFAQKIRSLRESIEGSELFYIKQDVSDISNSDKSLFDYIITKDKAKLLFANI